MSAKNVGYKQTADVSAATSLAALAPGGAIPTGCDFVYVQCEAQNCRWTDDGTTTPTANVGMILAVGDIQIIQKSNFSKFKIIQAAASAKVNVTFYKTG